MDNCVAVHPLTTRLSRKQERYAGVNAYLSCRINVRLCYRKVTLATAVGRMRKREA
jgi:hypothetical protein